MGHRHSSFISAGDLATVKKKTFISAGGLATVKKPTFFLFRLLLVLLFAPPRGRCRGATDCIQVLALLLLLLPLLLLCEVHVAVVIAATIIIITTAAAAGVPYICIADENRKSRRCIKNIVFTTFKQHLRTLNSTCGP
jgi:hypothetical protein